MFQVENAKLSLNPKSLCLSGYSYDNKQWKHSSTFLTSEDVGLAMVTAALESKLHREIVDFELHLDDPNLDIFNSDLTEKLRKLIE